MILDSSVIVALVHREAGVEGIIEKLIAGDRLAIGSPTLVEAGIVIEARTGIDSRSLLDRFLVDFDVVTIEFGPAHWREAVSAFRRYGKGRHPAALSFGDCLTYAVARLANEPLLFVGEDFSKTDLVRA